MRKGAKSVMDNEEDVEGCGGGYGACEGRYAECKRECGNAEKCEEGVREVVEDV